MVATINFINYPRNQENGLVLEKAKKNATMFSYI